MREVDISGSLFFLVKSNTLGRREANVNAERKKACQLFLPTTRGLSSPTAERSWSHTVVVCLGDGAESDSRSQFPLQRAGIWSLCSATSLVEHLEIFFEMALEYKIGKGFNLASVPPLPALGQPKGFQEHQPWGACEVRETVMSRSFGEPRRTFPGEWPYLSWRMEGDLGGLNTEVERVNSSSLPFWGL